LKIPFRQKDLDDTRFFYKKHGIWTSADVLLYLFAIILILEFLSRFFNFKDLIDLTIERRRWSTKTQ